MSSAQAFPASAAAKSRPPVLTLLPRFAWGVLAYNVAVILWGAVVRATSSGAGCGDHWPLCNGVVLQTHPRLATMIELAHRMSSGVTVIAVLAAAGVDISQHRFGHLARITAIAATVLTFNEALLGALLVLLRLTADNRSPARAVYLSLHLANTLLLLGALTLARTSSRARGFRPGARCALRNCRWPSQAGGHAGGGSERNAGRAQRYALSRHLALRRLGAGLLRSSRLAAARALSSPCSPR
jgi:heme A synthase